MPRYIDCGILISPHQQHPGSYQVRLHLPNQDPVEEVTQLRDETGLLAKFRELHGSQDSRAGPPRVPAAVADVNAIERCGAALFEAAFYGEVGKAFKEAVRQHGDSSKDHDLRFRLSIRTQVPSIHQLPWEYMYEKGYGFICCDPQFSVVRHVMDDGVPVQRSATAAKPPFHILGIASAVCPEGATPLNISDEQDAIESAIDSANERASKELFSIQWVTPPSRQAVREEIERGHFDIVHFIGHGTAGEDGVFLHLGETDESMDDTAVRGDLFATILKAGKRPPRLVVLNSCYAGQVGGTPFTPTCAETLIRHRVAAVVAMQFRIRDRDAVAFAREFYRKLVDGSVEAAVTLARQELCSRAWYRPGIPALYQAVGEGDLFDITQDVSGAMVDDGVYIDSIVHDPDNLNYRDLASDIEFLDNSLRTAHSTQRKQVEDKQRKQVEDKLCELYVTSANYWQQNGRTDNAVDDLNEVLKLHPNDIDVCMQLAKLLILNGQSAKATTLLNRVAGHHSDSTRHPELLDRLAAAKWIEARNHSNDSKQKWTLLQEAEAHCNDAIYAQPEQGRYYLTRARVRGTLGRNRDADSDLIIAERKGERRATNLLRRAAEEQ